MHFNKMCNFTVTIILFFNFKFNSTNGATILFSVVSYVDGIMELYLVKFAKMVKGRYGKDKSFFKVLVLPLSIK